MGSHCDVGLRRLTRVWKGIFFKGFAFSPGCCFGCAFCEDRLRGARGCRAGTLVAVVLPTDAVYGKFRSAVAVLDLVGVEIVVNGSWLTPGSIFVAVGKGNGHWDGLSEIGPAASCVCVPKCKAGGSMLDAVQVSVQMIPTALH